jgi:hypothetical protein
MQGILKGAYLGLKLCHVRGLEATLFLLRLQLASNTIQESGRHDKVAEGHHVMANLLSCHETAYL